MKTLPQAPNLFNEIVHLFWANEKKKLYIKCKKIDFTAFDLVSLKKLQVACVVRIPSALQWCVHEQILVPAGTSFRFKVDQLCHLLTIHKALITKPSWGHFVTPK